MKMKNIKVFVCRCACICMYKIMVVCVHRAMYGQWKKLFNLSCTVEMQPKLRGMNCIASVVDLASLSPFHHGSNKIWLLPQLLLHFISTCYGKDMGLWLS